MRIALNQLNPAFPLEVVAGLTSVVARQEFCLNHGRVGKSADAVDVTALAKVPLFAFLDHFVSGEVNEAPRKDSFLEGPAACGEDGGRGLRGVVELGWWIAHPDIRAVSPVWSERRPELPLLTSLAVFLGFEEAVLAGYRGVGGHANAGRAIDVLHLRRLALPVFWVILDNAEGVNPKVR